MNIAVIGGGITGMTLAYRLVQQGHKAVVYERSARPGGLVGSFKIGSVWLEKYFHHIFLSDVSLRKLIVELDLDKDMFWKVTPMGFYGKGKIHPFDGALDLLRFSVLSPVDRIRFGAKVWLAGKNREGLSLDPKTAKEWVNESWGGGIYENFWGPLLQSKFSDAADSISAAWLWGRIYARANSRSGGKEKLGYLRGGFVRILEELGKAVEKKGGEVRTQQEVKLVQRSGGQWSVQTDSGNDTYEKVVFSIPSPLIPKICPELPEDEKRTHQLISYVSILCMPVVMNRSLSGIYWLNVGDRTIPFTGVIEHTNYVPMSDYGNKHVAYLFNYLPMNHPWMGETKEVMFARYEEGLRRIFPNYRRDQVEQIMIFRDTYANVIYEKDYLKKIPPLVSKTPGVYYANTAHIFPDDRNQNYSVELAERVLREMQTQR
jgi:protoporphyrinogen oxidase